MWKLYIILCAFILGGCGNVATEIVMDPDLTPRQMEAIIKSANYWCEQGETCLEVSVGPNNGEGYVARQTSCIPGRAGYVSRMNLTIHLCDDRDHLLDRVAPHEVGHLLGFGHKKKDGFVMSRYVENQPCVFELGDSASDQ